MVSPLPVAPHPGHFLGSQNISGFGHRVKERPLSLCQEGCQTNRIYAPASLVPAFPRYLPTHYYPISCHVFPPNCHQPTLPLCHSAELGPVPPQPGVKLKLGIEIFPPSPLSLSHHPAPGAPGAFKKTCPPKSIFCSVCTARVCPPTPRCLEAPPDPISTLPLLIGIQPLPSLLPLPCVASAIWDRRVFVAAERGTNARAPETTD